MACAELERHLETAIQAFIYGGVINRSEEMVGELSDTADGETPAYFTGLMVLTTGTSNPGQSWCESSLAHNLCRTGSKGCLELKNQKSRCGST